MKLLLFLFTSSLLVSSVMSCLVVISDCPCGNIIDLAYSRAGVIYTEKQGCIQNITCPADHWTYVNSRMDSSEIPTPVDVRWKLFFFFSQNPRWSDDNGEFIDLFLFFGMECKDKTWFVTKYPTGVTLQMDNDGFKTFGGPDDYNGKKSKIDAFNCHDPYDYE